MRCPKCGYISFDHLENCLKCNKEIKKSADALHGTVFNAAAPSFLKFTKTEVEEESDFEQDFFEDQADLDLDTLDPDLDILLDDDTDASSNDGLDALSGLGDDDDFEISLDDDETDNDEISIDFNQFEDADIEDTPEEESVFTMDVPDELSDLSDLEPETIVATEAIKIDAPGAELSMDDDFDFDLNIDGLEEELNLNAPTDNTIAEASETAVLSLEEEDLSENLQKVADPNDMDADLNFDLDLGGLTLDK